MSNPAPDEDLYGFAEPLPVKIPVQPLAVESLDGSTVLPYRSLPTDKRGRADAETIKDLYLPLGLLGGGVLVEMLSALIWSHHVPSAFAAMAVDLTLGTGVMLAAMLIAARLRHINLGKIGVAAYKLAAVAIAPAALVEFLTPVVRFIPLGGLLSWIVEFILFFALLGALFDLDESDTWYCVWTIFVSRVAMFFLLRLGFGI